MRTTTLPKSEYEMPYTDTGCITKEWVRVFYKSDDWGFVFKPEFAGHSKNWCMGTLHIDIFSLDITIGPFELFFAYRMVVRPPKRSAIISGITV